jgi:photosystem II stability/assembly factor-like uncharacterized protein
MMRILLAMVLVVMGVAGCGGSSGQKSWQVVDVPTDTDLSGVACLSSGEVWVCGDDGVLLVKRGEEWEKARGYIGNDILSMCKLSDQEIWCGLPFGTFLRYNGQAWLKEKQIHTAQNTDVFFVTPEGELYSTGDAGDVLVYEDGAWRKHSQAPAPLTGLGADEEGILRASGGGWLWEYLGGVWEHGDIKLQDDARAFALSFEDELWCFNWNNSFKRLGSWRGLGNPVRQEIWDAVFSGDDEGWAVGNAGAIMQWDGTRWDTVKSPTDRDLRSLDVASNGDIWAAGKEGTLLHYY